MANTDDWGGVAVSSQPKTDDWGGVAVDSNTPKLPNMDGVKAIAQKNLAAIDNKGVPENGEAPPPMTMPQRLDTAIGIPAGKLLDPNDNTPPTPDLRKQYVKSIKDGSVSNFGDFMQNALHAVLPELEVGKDILHPIDTAENIKNYISENTPDVGKTISSMALRGGSYEASIAGRGLYKAGLTNAASLASGFADPILGGAGALAGTEYTKLGGELSPEAAEILVYPSQALFNEMGLGKQTPDEQKLQDILQSKGTEYTGIAPNYQPQHLMAKGVQTGFGLAPYLLGGELSLVSKGLTLAASSAGSVNAAEFVKQQGGSEKAQEVAGLFGMIAGGGTAHKAKGVWDNLPNKEALAQHIAENTGKDVKDVSSTDIDNGIAQGTNHLAPVPADFKAVETVTNNAVKEDTLHTIYAETGIKPDEVLHDAQHNPEIARDVIDGEIPKAYEGRIEQKEVPPLELKVELSPSEKYYHVLDKDGDLVQGHFDSAEEAQPYIEERKFEEEERAIIEAETIEKISTGEPKGDLTPYQQRYKAKSAEERESVRSAEKAKLDDLESKVRPYEDGTYEDLSPEEIAERDALRDRANRIKKTLEDFDTIDSAEPTVEKTPPTAKNALETHLDKPNTMAKGEQTSIAGTEAISAKELAERKMAEPMRANVEQKPASEGIFDMGARIPQGDLFKPEKKGVFPPSDNRPTNLRAFLTNNGAKFNEANELVSIKRGQGRNKETLKGQNALNYAHDISKEYGYLPKDVADMPPRQVRELQDALTENNGGRDIWRDADADKRAKSHEALDARKWQDPSFVEHQAHSAGIDTEPHTGETSKQTTKRLIKALEEFYKNEAGSASPDLFRKMAGETIKAAEKFAGKLGGTFFEKLGDGYVRTFQPELMGDLAKRADAYLAKYKTALQEAENSHFRQSAAEIRKWDKMTKDTRMQWLYDHETGRWSEAENPDHARFQALLDATYSMEKEHGAKEMGYKQNYLPHAWEDADAVKKYFSSDAYIKKYGADAFTKRSAFQLIQDGVRAGYKLKSDNPERMLVSRLLAGDNMARTMDLLHDMESSGIAKRATAFTVDKKIGELTSKIAETQKKYDEAFEKKNPKAQMETEGLPPASSKLIELYKERLDALYERLDALKAEAASNNLSRERMAELKNGFRVIGPDNAAWVLDQQIAPLWKNAMDMKGLWAREGLLGDWFRTYMQGKAIWVSTKLAFSLFHPSHMLGIHFAVDAGANLGHLARGGKWSDLDFSRNSLKLGFGKEGANPFARNKEATFGIGRDNAKIIAWNTPEAERTPQQHYDVQKMVEGGFKPTMSYMETVHARENFDKAIAGIGLNNLRLLGVAAQLPSKAMFPIMEHWIPSLKCDAYDYKTELALKEDPTLKTDAGRRGEKFREIGKEIDRSYGEMNQDTLFWDKNVRDAANAAFLSTGWKLAMLQNYRGLVEPLKLGYDYLKTGEFSRKNISDNMIQSYAYTAFMLMYGALLTKLMTGAVGGVVSWVYPDTGDKRPDGSEVRVSTPAFFKEFLVLRKEINEQGLLNGTAAFTYHQTLIPGIGELLRNSLLAGSTAVGLGSNLGSGHDFADRADISDPHDLHQWSNLGYASLPISYTAGEKAEEVNSTKAKIMGVLGNPIASPSNIETAFVQKVSATYFENHHDNHKDAYTAKLEGELKAAHSDKEREPIEKELRYEGVSDRDIKNIEREYKTKFVDFAWSKLTAQEQKQLIQSANKDEIDKYKLKNH